MSITGNLIKLALLSSTAMSVYAPSAIAQDAGFELEEIMVTATRRSTSTQDIPYNISAVSGASIDAANMVDSSELLRSIPGVAVPDRGARNSSTKNDIRIRGLNVDGAARGDYAASSAPTVATYINDTPIFANVMLKDLERVEVLRGPQGTLYGSGALGGAVRYITKKPSLEGFEGSVGGNVSKTKASGDMSWTTDLVLNVPLGEKLAIRVVGSHVDTAGIIDYMNVYDLDANMAPVVPGNILDNDASFHMVKDADSSDTDFFRISALFQPSETFDINLMYTRQKDNADGRRASAEGYRYGVNSENTYGKYEAGAVQLEPSEADIEIMSAEINVDLGFATLTSSTSLYDVEGSAISENSGFYAQKNWFGGLYYNSPRPLARADRNFGDEAFVQEVRLVSNNDGPLNWVAGLYYQDQEKLVGQASTLAGYKAWTLEAQSWMSDGFGYDDNDNDFIFTDLQKVKETAIFGEVTYDVSEDIHVTGGIRYFDSEVSSDAEVQLPFWDSLASWAPAHTVAESGKKDVLFKLNVSYDLNDDSMVYATVSEGYRRGGASAVPVTGNFAESAAWLEYAADTVVNYEMGLKGSTDTMRYTVAAFYVDWSNPQINTATSNWGFFTAANGNKAATKGLEFELEGQLSEALHYSVGYAFVNAKLKKEFNAPTGNGPTNMIAAAGNRLPGVPKHMLNLAVDYTTEISDIETVFRVSGYIQSKSENYINNDHATFGRNHAGFALWNASTTFLLDDFDVSVFVKNISNEMGTTASFSSAYMGTSPSQNYYGNGSKDEIALPRTIGIAAKYRF